VSEDRKNGDQPDGNSTVEEQDGMTLRDYFAAKAMAYYVGRSHESQAAESAYMMADYMLAQREKGGAK